MTTQERRITSIDLVTMELEVVGKTLAVFRRLLRDYFGNGGEIMAGAQEIDRLEHESDKLLRRLELMLLEQESLNRWDTDCLHLAETVDKIADRIEDASDTLVLTRPHIPNALIEPLLRMAEVTTSCFDSLVEGWRFLRTDPARVIESTHRVGDGEEVIDQLLWDATRQLYDGPLELAEKMQIKNLFDVTESVSNRIEDAGHALEILAIRERKRQG